MNITSRRRLNLVPVFGLLVVAPAALQYATRSQAAEPPKVVPIKIRPIDAKAAAQVSYAKQIKPLFEAKCISCHDMETKMGDLDMTTIEAMHKGGKKAGPSIINGKPDESPLVKYIRGTLKPQMPKRKKPLTEAELHLIRQWISAGAQDN
jgi:mono/diheme cytochrome c family protein